MSQEKTVTVVEPAFNPDRFVYMTKQILDASRPNYDLAFRRIRQEFIRAFEMGIAQGRQREDWYEQSMKESLQQANHG